MVPRYDGSEGELYDTVNDPGQRENLWDERRALREQLVEELRGRLPPERRPLPFAAPT